MSDNSETYIKMCREADLPWVPEIGVTTNKGLIIDICPKADNTIVYLCLEVVSRHTDRFKRNELTPFWSQAQLQGMSKKTENNIIKVMIFRDFVFWGDEIVNENWSMEQLWLAFVMWELHQKKWNGMVTSG